MMTIVTRVTLETGKEPVWDAAFRERAADARAQPGWVSVQVCIPADALNQRVIVGTWETRADWEAWHAKSAFQKTRAQMEPAESGSRVEEWHEVILSEHR
jgi:heme-degrading monooxygenase HmoA